MCHSFGALEVLSGIDLDVGEGEVLGVIGPSGCGKSTILSILGGLLAPTEGTVETPGTAPEDCLNELTFVFQDFALLPWRSVRDNVALPLEATTDERERARRVDEALERVDLAGFADALPRQLSGGMKQRVGLARAMAVKPAVLLMDEPLSALDAQTRELLKGDLERIWEELGCSTVYVTHNLSEAVALCDRIAVLSRRPARLRAILEVAVPRGDRRRGAPELVALEERLWSLLANEARDADRQVRASS